MASGVCRNAITKMELRIRGSVLDILSTALFSTLTILASEGLFGDA